MSALARTSIALRAINLSWLINGAWQIDRTVTREDRPRDTDYNICIADYIQGLTAFIILIQIDVTNRCVNNKDRLSL